MRKSGILLTVGVMLLLLATVLFVLVMTFNGWNFSKLNIGNYKEESFPVDKDFSNITIDAETDDILLLPSEDGKCKVFCRSEEGINYSVEVIDGKLSVNMKDERGWYDRISSYGGKIILYLSKDRYDSLTIDTDTSDIEINKIFSFGELKISLSTGDVKNYATVLGTLDVTASTGNISNYGSVGDALNITASTGDIKIRDVSAKAVKLSVSTGRINVENLTCEENINIKVSTGEVRLDNVSCRNLSSNGSTGDITLKSVVASGSFDIKRSTGDIKFDAADAAEITVKTDTGYVKGTLLSSKIFYVNSDTGKIEVPKSTKGGICEITTDTGDVVIGIKE